MFHALIFPSYVLFLGDADCTDFKAWHGYYTQQKHQSLSKIYGTIVIIAGYLNPQLCVWQ